VTVVLAAVAMTAAACSTAPKSGQPEIDPNAYPADYRGQIVGFLRQSLVERADFRGALISPPVLRPIGDSQRYMVCVQFNGHSQAKTKVAIYFQGKMAQFLDTTGQCAGAAYEPFKELEGAIPPQ
jgi:hypothetical protein